MADILQTKFCEIYKKKFVRCILVNEKFCILITISLKFVPESLIDNKSALVQVMAWHPTGDKPLPEPMLI